MNFVREDIIAYYSLFMLPVLVMVLGYFFGKWDVGDG